MSASPYVIAVAVGPVGSFIGGGRRSRDLWFGSRFLSEATRRAARSLRDAGAELIIPLPGRIDESFLLEESYQKPTISNKILCAFPRLTAGGARAELDRARRAAHEFLAEQLDALCEDGRFGRLVRPDDVKAQADAIRDGDFIELYAVWTPGSAADPRVVDRAWQLLAARKGTRSFGAAQTAAGRPKSLLDPGRDSVLKAYHPSSAEDLCNKNARERRIAGIDPTERLDALSLARRRAAFTGTKAELPRLPFLPIARIVADPWIEGAARIYPDELRAVRSILDSLRHDKDDSLYLFSSPCREPGRNPAAPLFDFDPSLFIENGIDALQRTLEKPPRIVGDVFPEPQRSAPGAAGARSRWLEDTRSALATLERLEPHVQRLHKALGVPHPYYAVLEADGDDIGKLMSGVTAPTRDALVRALYDFADAAWSVVEQHHGCAFYAGADELLAFAALDKALPLARALAACFQARLDAALDDKARQEIRDQGSSPTLSVGVAIAHLKDDLRATRRSAGEALRAAKDARKADNGKQAFVHVDEIPRAGAARQTWGPVDHLVTEMAQWRDEIVRGAISMKTAHALLDLCDRLHPSAPGVAPVSPALARCVARQKAKRRGDEGSEPLERRLAEAATWNDVQQIAHEILLAHRLRTVADQRDPTPEEPAR